MIRCVTLWPVDFNRAPFGCIFPDMKRRLVLLLALVSCFSGQAMADLCYQPGTVPAAIGSDYFACNVDNLIRHRRVLYRYLQTVLIPRVGDLSGDWDGVKQESWVTVPRITLVRSSISAIEDEVRRKRRQQRRRNRQGAER
jgi:hypothetical protein